MEINYESIQDPKIRRTVEVIESKPHVRWIRYLLTKRYSPISIKRELQKLGLSAPHEKPLVVYYLAVIDPLVKKYKIGPIYSDYKGRLTNSTNKRGAYSYNILKYRLEEPIIKDRVMETNFCRFITELEIDECWSTELIRYYGKVENVPVDEYGEKIIKSGMYKRSLEKLLIHPKRYIIDKMILENVPTNRIVTYVNKNFDNLKIFDYDISYYKEIFFNTRSYNVEGKIRLLSTEKNDLENMLKGIEIDEDMELGERTALIQKLDSRIKELDDNIKLLNAMYSESSMRSLELERDNIPKLFEEMVFAGYKRFCALDKYQDRDVVDPLFKVARMTGYAWDKALESRTNMNSANDMSRDNNKNEAMVNLYRERVEELYQEQQESLKEASSYFSEGEDLDCVDNVEGVDELNILGDYPEDEDINI